MRIGLDIDNVILDTDVDLFIEFLKEDKNKRNKGVINPNLYLMSGMFDWTSDEVKEFLNLNMERIAQSLKPKKNAKHYMDKLLEDGHELYLISNRSKSQYKDAYSTTAFNLSYNNINYTKLIITESRDKTNECILNGIDIMFDDRPKNCFILLQGGIRCCLFRSNYETRDFDNLEVVNDWEELYEKIMKIN